MTKPPDFGAMCANELTERDQGGLRPKRLKFVETYPEQSLDLHCIAAPIGRYEITFGSSWVVVWLVDKWNYSVMVVRCDKQDEAINAAQLDFEQRMLEGMEYA